MWNIKSKECNSVGYTFAISYDEAVNNLHEWIKDNLRVVEEYPKCKFKIEVLTGSVDVYGDPRREVVYVISANKAKRFLK